ncbi:MAG: cytochrome c [Verrucomicrobiaceae bacterium]|nr:MAG: cytochrome c [Verrucomicrobiaceae bacterium]
MRYFFFAYLLSIVLVVGFAGFRGDKFTHTPIEIFNDMDQQAKVKAQGSNAFFANGVGSRKPVTGTIPMGLKIPDGTAASGSFAVYGFSHGGDYYNTGRIGDFWGDGFPEQVTVDAAFLRLGRERYDINCTPCHGKAGNGLGITSHYGMANIANFSTPAFTNPQAPDYRSNGNIFDTITHGRGQMGPYGANIPVKERWAIIAWVRTMEISRTAPLSEPSIKDAWTALAPPSTAAAAPATTPAAVPAAPAAAQ